MKTFIIDICALIYRPQDPCIGSTLVLISEWMLFCIWMYMHAKCLKRGLETNRIPYHTLSLAFFLFNLENTKSAFIKILAVLANVCHPPVCSLLIQCWERFRRKNGINHSNDYVLQCLPSQMSSFLSTGVEHAYLPINLCPVVDCESQWILFPWLRNLLGCSPLSGIAHASLAFHKDNYRNAFLPVFTKLVRTYRNLLSPAFWQTLAQWLWAKTETLGSTHRHRHTHRHTVVVMYKSWLPRKQRKGDVQWEPHYGLYVGQGVTKSVLRNGNITHTKQRVGGIQHLLFPCLLELSSLCATNTIGDAWWLFLL